MRNFTVGPVQMDDSIRMMGSNQIPYFRTKEFSELMLENEELIKEFINAEADSRVVFLTGSGTAAMEAAVMEALTIRDKALVINGGTFGQRFVDLCKLHNIPHEELKLKSGESLTKTKLLEYENLGITVLLINVHETSTGILYDMEIVREFCKNNNIFIVADVISTFLADKFDMSYLEVDIAIVSSQKAIACPPGISMLVLNNRAQKKVWETETKSFYLSIKSALKDGGRGQTPFTPAVGILIQLNQRLKNIKSSGGIKGEITKVQKIAMDFRERLENLPLRVYCDNLSNALTPIYTENYSAEYIFEKLINDYNIWVCPSGGTLKNNLLRIGHIGALDIEDNIILIEALRDIIEKYDFKP